MLRLNKAFLVILSIAAAPVISACGDGVDDRGGSGDEAQISEVIETALLSTDPADCTKLQTQRFVEQITFMSGEEAVVRCESNAADTLGNPDSVEVSKVEVDGTSGTADVAVVGSTFDGSILALGLVKEGDQWKVDEISGIPEFDFEGFQAAFSEQLARENPPEATACITDAFAAAGAAAVKAALISGDQAQLTALVRQCAGGG